MSDSINTIESRQTELDALCDELWPTVAAQTTAQATSTAPAVGDGFDKLITRCANAQEGERSENDFALCAEGNRRGLDPEAVWPLVASIGKFAERGREYFDRTWHKAASAVAASKLDLLSIEGRNGSANAKRFIARYGDRIRYCAAWKRWLIYDGRRWSTDETLLVEAMAKMYADSLWADYRKFDHKELDEKLLREVRQFIRATNDAAGIQNLLSLSRSEPGVAVRAYEFDVDPWLLNCENGTIDLRTGTLRPHDRDDYLTKLAPVTFDPAAKCPKFEAFLNEIFNSVAALVSFVQRWFGYKLTGSVREQKMVVGHGSGANGKSTLVEQIMATMGDYALKSPPKLLMAGREAHPTERACLFGKRAVFVNETDEGSRFDEATIKDLTGGDKQTARRLYQDFWSFEPTHKLTLATNHRPTIRGSDAAIWRRIVLLPFDVSIPESRQNRNLGSELAEEASGILAWLVRGCLEWQRIGLAPPAEAIQATAEYRAGEDQFGSFVTEYCELGDAKSCGATELLTAYREAAGDEAISPKQFATLLRGRGFKPCRLTAGPSKGCRQWQGISLRVNGEG